MEINYIIVQAGGKGSRMGFLTKNRPKALVPVDNLPIMFHLFNKYPEKRFIIISDYKIEVMKKYLAAFAHVKYLIVDASGRKGTCAGINDAIMKIPKCEPFMIIWSDLVLNKSFVLPEITDNYVGLSNGFRCRWCYENGEFEEKPSMENGVAGLFLFINKEQLTSLPDEGEFVRWLQSQHKEYETLLLDNTREYGIQAEYLESTLAKTESRCRAFNSLEKEGDIIIKKGITRQGEDLAIYERQWYQTVTEKKFSFIPRIVSYEPLKMSWINGRNIYQYQFDTDKKKNILKEIVTHLKELHDLDCAAADHFSIYEAYYLKTVKRLNKVRNIIPLANERYIEINNRRCRNVFLEMEKLEKLIEKYDCTEFKMIHGDCTFSNIMLNEDETPIFIDPRGYFGHTELYGDPAYDWAKLYYSLYGNYDSFNNKEFELDILEKSVMLNIKSNEWEETENYFFDLIHEYANKEKIKLIHAIIWLSLTAYVWEDYDAVCGSFYNGLYYLEEIL